MATTRSTFVMSSNMRRLLSSQMVMPLSRHFNQSTSFLRTTQCLHPPLNQLRSSHLSTRLTAHRNTILSHSLPWISRQKTPISFTFSRSHSGRNYASRNAFLGRLYFLPRRAIVPIIAGACVVVFGWSYFEQEEARKGSRDAMRILHFYRDKMVLSLRNYDSGRWYTTLTTIFAHGSPLHLVFNVMALLSFGQPIAAAFGATQFAALFFGAGVVGSLAQLKWWRSQHADPNQGAVGASAAISGLLGFTAFVNPGGTMSMFFIPLRMATGTAIFAAGSIACLSQGWIPYVGHADHLGGLAFGFLYALATRRLRPA